MKILSVTNHPGTSDSKATTAALGGKLGITTSIYLQPNYSQKKGGQPVVIRVTYNKKHVYLTTDLYAGKKEFNEVKKVFIDTDRQDNLDKLYAAAIKLISQHQTDLAAIKAIWEKTRKGVTNEKHVLSFIERHENYALDDLLEERERLEKELVEINELIITYSTALERNTKKASATEKEKQEFREALELFKDRWNTLKKRDKQAWESWLKTLEEAAKLEKVPLAFAAIDLSFYSKYANHILVTRGNFDNTFGAHVKKLKAFLKFSEQNNYPVNKAYKDSRFKIWEEEKEIIYLNEKEMNMLWAFRDIKPVLTKAIHLATFQNLTGLRVSDVMKKHHITIENGNEFLISKCEKNDGIYTIPLAIDERIKEVLELYNYDLRIMSEKYYNELLKRSVAEMYDYNELEMPIVEIRPTKQGVAYPYFTPKNLELGTHSMRRSFVTRHVNNSHFQLNDIKAMLGSKDIKELQKYMRTENSSLVTKAVAARKK
jgi:hypothetical protein